MNDDKGSCEFEETVAPAQVEPTTMSFRTAFCASGALVAVFATVYGVSATGTYAGPIAATLGASAKAGWLSNSAQVVQIILGPPAALAADLYGRRWFGIVGMILGCIGAIVTGTATNASIGILGSVITGLAVATQALYLAILSEVIPRSLRPIGQAVFNLSSSSGGVSGVLVGGLFLRHEIGTKWIYFVLAISYGLAAIALFVLYRPGQHRPDSSSYIHHKRLAAIDLPGAGLLLIATPLFYFGLLSGHNPYPWTSATVLAPLLIGIMGFVAFGLYEWKGTSEGLLHHALFSKSRNYAICLALVWLEGVMFFSFNSQWARETSLVVGLPASEAGLLYEFFWVPSLIATPFIGYFAKKYKEVKVSITAGYILFVATAIGMATVTPSSRVALRVYAALAGIGFSAPLTLISTAAQLAAPPQLMALASVNLLCGRALGGVVSVSVYSAVLKSKFASQIVPAIEKIPALPQNALKSILAAASLAEPQFSATIDKIPGLSAANKFDVISTVRDTYAKSYRYVWIIAAPFAVLAVVLTLCLEPVAPMMTAQVDAPAERIHKGESEGEHKA